MTFPFSFNIRFCNIRGLGLLSENKNNFRTSRISHKIKELDYSNDGTITLYAVVETKAKPNKKTVKLPNHLKFVGETCKDGKGGILVYSHKSLLTESFAVISSKHACFVKIKLNDTYVNNIIVYLPCELKECLQVLNDIEKFIVDNNLVNFCVFGDFNISFSSPNHLTKAKRLQKLLDKFNLFDLAEKLNCNNSATWFAMRNDSLHSSKIDHFFCNFNGFNRMRFEHNSFSDHMHATISFKKQFIYHPPGWKSYLFKKNDFNDLLTKESISFLFDMCDKSSLKHELEFYINNPLIADAEFSFKHLEYNHTSAFFSLLLHLKKVHDKYLSKLKMKNFHKTKDFHDKISNMFAKFDENPSDAIKEQIKNLVLDQQTYFKTLVFSQAESNYMRKLQNDGGNNSFTFKHIPNNKMHDHRLKIDGETIVEPQRLANIFAEIHAKTVSPEIVPQSTLNELLNNYELTMDEVFPRIKNLTNPFSSTSEFKKILSSMKNTSAPGISTQPKILFEFLIDLLPSFVTNALNNLYTIDNIDESPFKFIKDRNVVFIPKKNCDLSLAESFRAIALLEVVYKLISKALNKKLTFHLENIIHSEQFGYVPERTMATCSLNITATLNHAVQHNQICQAISFDFSKAFDKVLTEVINAIIVHIFPSGNFSKSFINLTTNGRFRAAIKGHFSKFFQIKVGSSQGDAPSGSKFIILNHIFICCLLSKRLKNSFYKIGKTTIAPKSYADDTFAILQLKSNREIHELIILLKELKNSIGLEINFQKSKILVHGLYPRDLHKLGEIVQCIKHLGVYISFDEKLARRKTYSELCTKLENKAKTIPLRGGYNLIKRRNLCSSLMTSCAFHIYRIYPPTEDIIKKLWKIISQFLWSIRKSDGEITYRYKIAKKRIELDITNGGLNFLRPENQSFSIWLNSFMSSIKHSAKYPDSTIGTIFKHRHLPIKSLLHTFGFQTLIKYQKTFKSIYPCNGGDYFSKAVQFFYELEHDELTFFYSPIISSNYSNISTPFTLTDERTLISSNKLTIASILTTINVGKNVLFLPIIDSEFKTRLELTEPNLVDKLIKVVESLKSSFPKTSCVKVKKSKRFLIPLGKYLMNNNSIFSFHFKRMHRAKFNSSAPAIGTRKRDKLYFPDKEIFDLSFRKIFSLPIFLHYKNFFFEQFLRILPSKNKLYKFNIADTNMCNKCNVICTIEHALFNCTFPKYFIHILARFLDYKFNNNCPQFIFLKRKLLSL